MNALQLGALVLAACVALGAAARAADSPPAETTEGLCTVRVAAVAPVDAAGTVQAVVLEPTVSGSGVLSGSVALFTQTNIRYDLRFENAPLSSSAPDVLVYRFPAAVRLTGAYVASLDAPSPGPCRLEAPWTSRNAEDAPVQHALASAAGVAPVDVADAGRPDPLTCAVPSHVARVVKIELPNLRFFARDGGPNGDVYVRVLIDATGQVRDAVIDRVTGDIGLSVNRTRIEASVLDAAKRSTYLPGSFRCRPIDSVYVFVSHYTHETRL